MGDGMLKFEVLFSSWTADGEEFAGGEHEVASPSPELVRLAGSAHAAGAIRVDEGLDMSHVEDDEDSAERLAEAMGEWVEPVRDVDTNAVLISGYWSGPWSEGHAINQALDAENRATPPAEEE